MKYLKTYNESTIKSEVFKLVSGSVSDSNITISKLKKILPDFDKKSISNNRTLIQKAIANKKPKIVKFLIEQGFGINDFKCLYEAIHKTTLNMVQLLIKNGADVNKLSHDFRSSLLGFAYFEHKKDICIELLKNGADPELGEISFIDMLNGNKLNVLTPYFLNDYNFQKIFLTKYPKYVKYFLGTHPKLNKKFKKENPHICDASKMGLI